MRKQSFFSMLVCCFVCLSAHGADLSGLQRDQHRLDSLRQADGYSSPQYRSALGEFVNNYFYLVGCDMVLAYLEQVNQWDVVTKEDLAWIDDSLRIVRPCDESETLGDYFYDVDMEMTDSYSFYCSSYGGTKKYFDLYLPLVARVYGSNSTEYYAMLLYEAQELTWQIMPRVDPMELPLFDILYWDEAIMTADTIQPVRLAVVSDNLDKVRKEWKDVGSDEVRVNMYYDMAFIGRWTFDADVLEAVVASAQALGSGQSVSKETAATVQEIIGLSNMYIAIIRKDLPLFHKTVRMFQHSDRYDMEVINYLLAEYLEIAKMTPYINDL